MIRKEKGSTHSSLISAVHKEATVWWEAWLTKNTHISVARQYQLKDTSSLERKCKCCAVVWEIASSCSHRQLIA